MVQTNEEELAETTGGGFQRPKKSPVKEAISTVRKGGKEIGSKVASGASALAKKGVEAYKEYNTPEAKQKRLDDQEAALERQVRVQTQKNRIRKLQSEGREERGSAPSFMGGFQGIDMQNVLSGEGSGGSGRSIGGSGAGLGGGNIDFGANLNNAFGSIGGTSPRATAPAPRRYKTIRTVKRYRVKKGKGRGKFRTRTIKRRVPMQKILVKKAKAFDPFSQF